MRWGRGASTWNPDTFWAGSSWGMVNQMRTFFASSGSLSLSSWRTSNSARRTVAVAAGVAGLARWGAGGASAFAARIAARAQAMVMSSSLSEVVGQEAVEAVVLTLGDVRALELGPPAQVVGAHLDRAPAHAV